MLPISKKEPRNSYFVKKELFKELREKRNSLVKKGTKEGTTSIILKILCLRLNYWASSVFLYCLTM
jgi:hypothetical protein